MLPGKGLAVYDHPLKSVLRARYGYTDDPPRDRRKDG